MSLSCRRYFYLSLFLLSLMVSLAWPNLPTLAAPPDESESSPPTQLNGDFGQLPLYFIENRGQLDDRVVYYVQGRDKTLYFTAEGVTFALSKAKAESESEFLFLPQPSRYILKLDFIGANSNVQPIGLEPTDAVISYFKGPHDQWHTGLPTYTKLVYPDLWPGIDLVYSGTVNRLKYEFVVKPGADPNQIELAYRGATAVRVNQAGQLEISTPVGGFHDDTPYAFQEIDGRRVPVTATYALEKTSAYRFHLGNYDRSQPLIIDPAVLVYAGFIGGGGDDRGYDIAVDSAGSVYITGSTDSPGSTFPETVGPDLSHNGGVYDAFIAKVNPAGTALIYAGYIGGSGVDEGYGVAVDSSGSAYLTGYTDSAQTSGFPVIGGPDVTYNGDISPDPRGDAFIAKVNPGGTALVYAGYIGGSMADMGHSIALDNSNRAYVVGLTNSREDSNPNAFPVTIGPDVTHNDPGVMGGSFDAFVVRVRADGSGFAYAGYIGGSADDRGYDVAVDSAGNAYVTGETQSDQATFPESGGPDLSHNGSRDAFVAQVNTSGTGLVYAGYLGGNGDDAGTAIAVDSTGAAYLAGETYSDQTTFPEIAGPDLMFGGVRDAFAAKIRPNGSGLDYAGYIGGSDDESGRGIALDSAGNAYVTGYTASADFPVSNGPDLSHNGGLDAFIAQINASGNGFNYAGFIGGSGNDDGWGIAVDSAGSAYLTGQTNSTEATFPGIGGPDLSYNGGIFDAFVSKVTVTTFIVNSTNDTDDGVCNTIHCSLREAINLANATSGSKNIHFNIPTGDSGFDGSVFTIRPLTQLPNLNGSTNINGSTQTTFSGNTNPLGPEVVLNGSLQGSGSGLRLSGDDNTVSGLVINGFSDGPGIAINYPVDSTPSRNQIRDNYIGVNSTGTQAVFNDYGIDIQGFGSAFAQAQDNVIENNLISGHTRWGIALCDAAQTRIVGNRIGTDRSGTAALGNGLDGITMGCAGAPRNLIENNIIAFNGEDGVRNDPDYRFGVAFTADGHQANLIRNNAIFSNVGLGINLLPPPYQTIDGVTPNDSGDTDTGGNLLQNYPILTSATITGPNMTISGTLNSGPNAAFTLDFYASRTCDPSGYGEGEFYLGVGMVNTNGNGDVSFTLGLSATVPVGYGFITATATDIGNNISEFSQCLPFTSTDLTITKSDSPDPVNAGATLTYTIRITNTGPATATALTVTDTLPTGVAFVSAGGTGWTCSQTAGVVTCTRPSLSVGVAPNIVITTTAPIVAGVITNTAMVTSAVTDPTTPNTAVATTTVASPPTVQFSAANYNVLESAGTATITATLSAASSLTVTVNYATSNGTAIAPGDYTASSGTLTFAPGQTSRNFTIPIINDSLAETNEAVNLTLSSPTNATISGTNPAALTIVDNDLIQVQFSTASYSVSENVGSATITTTLSAVSSLTVTVNYATSNGTALAPGDYTAGSGTLTFAPGQTSRTFTVPIINDLLDEANETLNLTLSSPVSATLGSPNPATLTIVDTTPPPTVQFSVAGYSVAENSGTATITVTLSAASGLTATVNYATSNGTAIAPGDYTASNGTLTFAPGQTSRTFTVPIVNDALFESNETVTLSLNSPANATLGSPNPATLTIITNDDPQPTLQFSSNSGYNVNEDSGTAAITVTLSTVSGVTATVNYATTSGGTATAGTDYLTRTGALTFTPGTTSLTFTVIISDDLLDEDNETVNLSLTGPVNASLGGSNPVTLTIIDDEPGSDSSQFVYLPIILRDTRPPLKLSLKNETGGTLQYSIFGTPQGDISCQNIPNGSTIFCGEFMSGVYQTTATSTGPGCGSTTVALDFPPGVCTRIVRCGVPSLWQCQ